MTSLEINRLQSQSFYNVTGSLQLSLFISELFELFNSQHNSLFDCTKLIFGMLTLLCDSDCVFGLDKNDVKRSCLADDGAYIFSRIFTSETKSAHLGILRYPTSNQNLLRSVEWSKARSYTRFT